MSAGNGVSAGTKLCRRGERHERSPDEQGRERGVTDRSFHFETLKRKRRWLCRCWGRMEYGFCVPLLSEHSVSTVTSSTLSLLSPEERERLRIVVDNAGRRSAHAQDLNQPITSLTKLAHSDHVLHVCAERITPRKTVVVGIIKTGRKKLFIYNDSPVLQEIEPVCVLDFYVHESFQRKGYGKKLFEHVLQHERARPENLAYDRPSPKFLAFLSKHYSLSNYVPQRNNFVVFRRYFTSPSAKTRSPPLRKATKAGDAWTPISQRPLTAKRKMYRRDREATPLKHAGQQTKAQAAFHRNENFVHFKEKPKSLFAGAHQEDTYWKRSCRVPPPGTSYPAGLVEVSRRPQENGVSFLERSGNAKFGRRSGRSPKGPTVRFDSRSNVLHNNELHGLSKSSGNNNRSRITSMKHMAGQGAASCLVW